MPSERAKPTPDDPAERAEVERLVNEYFKLAVKIARRWGGFFPWLSDDFESDAGLALLKAAHTRHGWRNEFASLVHLHVSSACMRRLDLERKANPAAFAREPAAVDERGRVEAVELLADDATPAEVMAEVSELLGRLSPSRRAQIVRHFFHGETWVELAAERGVTKQAVEAMAKRDLERVRRLVSDTTHEE